jgi:hypothetical protein
MSRYRVIDRLEQAEASVAVEAAGFERKVMERNGAASNTRRACNPQFSNEGKTCGISSGSTRRRVIDALQ